MFSKIHLKNFGAFADFTWSDLGSVNVVVGENDTGKSHLLKAMYVLAKSVEALKKGDDEDLSWQQRVFRKSRWTFQPTPGFQALIHHGAQSAGLIATILGQRWQFNFTFDSKSKKTVLIGKTHPEASADVNAIFIPPKEILTTFSAIAVTRESLEIFGFDDTYYDLIKLLRIPPTQGEIDPHLSKVLDDLRDLFDGKIVKAQSSDEFRFNRGKRSYGMPQTADGIKKIGILATLIENRSLNRNSILFLDEPETNLHPKAITYLTRMLFEIGRTGAQVILSTHNYLVLKQLQILAKKYDESIPFCSLVREKSKVVGQLSDLREGMPDNPIVDESIRLYREELEVDLAKGPTS